MAKFTPNTISAAIPPSIPSPGGVPPTTAAPPIRFRRPNELTPSDFPVTRASNGTFDEVEPLMDLCSKGRLYEVEAWIAAGRPIQFAATEQKRRRRWLNPLRIALENDFFSLGELLLANGYDPDGGCHNLLTMAVCDRKSEWVDLLLRFGANTKAVDFQTVLECGDRAIRDRFVAEGANPCDDDAIYRTLGKNFRCAIGFVKEYEHRFPQMRTQIHRALRDLVEASNVRGVALLRWLGADPHWLTAEETAESGPWDGRTAFDCAVRCGPDQILKMFLRHPIPETPRPGILLAAVRANRLDFVRRVLRDGAGAYARSECGVSLLKGVMDAFVYDCRRHSWDEKKKRLEAIEILLEAGARWEPVGEERKKLKELIEDHVAWMYAKDLIDLLRKHSAMSPGTLEYLMPLHHANRNSKAFKQRKAHGTTRAGKLARQFR